MSYYMMAAEFWTSVGLGMGVLPVVVASASKVANTFKHSHTRFDEAAPLSTQRATAGCTFFDG